MDADLAEEGLVQSLSEFDPSLAVSVNANQRQAASAASELDGSDQPVSEGQGVAVDLSRKLGIGTTLQLDGNLGRNDTDSSFATLNPAYDADAGISLSQPLLKNRGRVVHEAGIRRGEIAVMKAEQGLLIDVMDLLERAELVYWRARVAQERLRIQSASLASARALLEETREKERHGLQTKVDVLQAEAGAASKEENLILTRQEIADVSDQLWLLMGESMSLAPKQMQLDDLPEDLPDAPSPEVSLQTALQVRPEYLLQKQAIAERRIDEEVAARRHLPNLDLNARASYSGLADDFDGAFEGVANGDGYNWRIGMAFGLPWGMRGSKSELAEARIRLMQSNWDLRRVEQELEADMRSACRAVEAGNARLQVTRLSLEVAEEQRAQEQGRFDVGLVTVRQVLDVQEDFDNARLRELEAIQDTQTAWVKLQRLEGTLLERHDLGWKDVMD